MKHGALRRSVARAFTPVAALEYECHVDQTVPDLIEALRRHAWSILHRSCSTTPLMLPPKLFLASRLDVFNGIRCWRYYTAHSGSIESLGMVGLYPGIGKTCLSESHCDKNEQSTIKHGNKRAWKSAVSGVQGTRSTATSPWSQ